MFVASVVCFVWDTKLDFPSQPWYLGISHNQSKLFSSKEAIEQQLPAAIYSASAIDKDTEFCLLLIQATRLALT